MHPWIQELKPGQRVLDLGAGAGSLKLADYACSLISVDCDRAALQAGSGAGLVLATGESLPFAPSSFDLVVCNHVRNTS